MSWLLEFFIFLHTNSIFDIDFLLKPHQPGTWLILLIVVKYDTQGGFGYIMPIPREGQGGGIGYIILFPACFTIGK